MKKGSDQNRTILWASLPTDGSSGESLGKALLGFHSQTKVNIQPTLLMLYGWMTWFHKYWETKQDNEIFVYFCVMPLLQQNKIDWFEKLYNCTRARIRIKCLDCQTYFLNFSQFTTLRLMILDTYYLGKVVIKWSLVFSCFYVVCIFTRNKPSYYQVKLGIDWQNVMV